MMTKSILIAALSLMSGVASAGGDYLVVYPSKAPPAFAIHLSAAPLPIATLGKPYSANLKPLLKIYGDSGYQPDTLQWSLLQGPEGLTIQNGILEGVISEAGPHVVRAMVSYKNQTGEQSYSIITNEILVSLAGVGVQILSTGQAYSLDLGSGLSVLGDPDYEPNKAQWALSSGSLPAGLSMTGGLVDGVPTKSGEYLAAITAAYGGKQATIPLSMEVHTAINQFDGYRAWGDGSFASSCLAYKQGSKTAHYRGAIGDGVYRIKPETEPFDVLCDMTTDGGGWALIMKQAPNDGVTLQGDTVYWTQGKALNDTEAGRSLSPGNLVSKSFSQLKVSELRLQATNEVTMKTRTLSSKMTPLDAFSDARREEYSDQSFTLAPSLPNWFIHASTYANGVKLSSARFGFNFRNSGYAKNGTFITCAVRWGWTADENTNDTVGTHDSCGGLGGWGSQYGSGQMLNSKNTWQPAGLLLWAR